MNCPTCGSNNVRASRKESRLEFFHNWRGLYRYRCRDCHRSFRTALSAVERAQVKNSEVVRRKRARGWSTFIQSPTQRRAIEIVLFVGMLLVFYVAFSSFVPRDGSGLFTRPSADAQH